MFLGSSFVIFNIKVLNAWNSNCNMQILEWKCDGLPWKMTFRIRIFYWYRCWWLAIWVVFPSFFFGSFSIVLWRSCYPGPICIFLPYLIKLLFSSREEFELFNWKGVEIHKLKYSKLIYMWLYFLLFFVFAKFICGYIGSLCLIFAFYMFKWCYVSNAT